MTQSEEVARSTGGLWTHPDPKAHVMAHNAKQAVTGRRATVGVYMYMYMVLSCMFKWKGRRMDCDV